MFTFELQWRKNGKKRIAGIDEAGRGPLAGPVVAAAVILPEKFSLSGVNDSKQLTENMRDKLFRQINEYPEIQVGVGIVSERVIDKINILQATKKAMRQAVMNLPEEPDHLLIDGLLLENLYISQTKIIKGDSKSASIASASIVAKVVRDEIMKVYESRIPGYNFAKHKGYGTKEHTQALQNNGISVIHRLSFAPVRDTLQKDSNGQAK